MNMRFSTISLLGFYRIVITIKTKHKMNLKVTPSMQQWHGNPPCSKEWACAKLQWTWQIIRKFIPLDVYWGISATKVQPSFFTNKLSGPTSIWVWIGQMEKVYDLMLSRKVQNIGKWKTHLHPSWWNNQIFLTNS